MRRRFVIGIDGLNAAEEKEFREYISEQGAWWHWINNLWLLTTKDEDITTAKIRNRILKIDPDARVIVFEFAEDIDWAASGSTNSKGKKLSGWIKETWSAD